ncbi:kinase-like domain-containing protein [Aspergillus unguis]
MASLLSRLSASFKLTRSIKNIVKLPLETPIEEETLPHYNPAHYYPVQIGDVYYSMYKISGKLGYGAYSTSRLCQDFQGNGYNVLKVSTSLPDHPTASDRELRVYEHLSKVKSMHPGQSLIRELYDSFDLQGPGGTHRCLVLQPMNFTLLEMMGMNSKPFGLPLLKMTIRRLLLALVFLHTEAGVVHTDLKPDNLMLSLEDHGMLTNFAAAEIEDPSPRKVVDSSRTIYLSRKFRRPTGSKNIGLPILCDFREARIGKTQESGPFIQPHIYRAPEVIFEMPWGSAIDIWNLAGLIWDLFEGEHLFDGISNSKGRHDPFKHLPRMVALIGPPPV